jgi:proteasome lid subunit RPN8/RPN11
MTDEPGTPAALVISPEMRASVVAHLRSALPNEGVGLLAVEWRDASTGRVATACRFYPGTNIRSSPSRFEMDPRELIAVLAGIDERGWSLGAIVHSHPNGPATPSRTDLAEAFYPESLMVIASFAAELPDLQAWRLEPDGAGWQPRNVPIVVAADPAGIAAGGGFRE